MSRRMQAGRSATLLGLLGLVPFGGLTLIVWISGPSYDRFLAMQALVAWGTVILGFMAGARWAMILLSDAAPPLGRLAAVGIFPPTIGLIAPLLEPRIGLGLLAVALGGLLVFELSTASRAEAPPWYPRLRLFLSSGALACLIVAIIVGG